MRNYLKIIILMTQCARGRAVRRCQARGARQKLMNIYTNTSRASSPVRAQEFAPVVRYVHDYSFIGGHNKTKRF